MTLSRLACVLLVLPLCAVARAEDKPAVPAPTKKTIENPTYKTWAAFKVGATAKYDQDGGVAGQKTTMTWKLVELSADKAVLEMTMASVVGDQTFDMPASRSDVPKMLEVVEPPQDPNQPTPAIKQGTGSITTPAGTFACKTVETTLAMAGVTSTSKVWSSADVPGGLVKMESSTLLPGGTTAKSTMTLVAVTK